MKEHLREKMAEAVHDTWTNWMDWLFKNGSKDNDGRFILNKDAVARWERQMATPYANLSEIEKNSDRQVADKHFKVVLDHGFLID